jgi:type IV secretory pathway TrbD component
MTGAPSTRPSEVSGRSIHPVYRAMNKPLTIWGVERKLFLLALMVAVSAFNFFASLLAGIALFAALYALARWATATDPQALRILLNSAKCRSCYDPLKRQVAEDRSRS